MTLVRDSTPPVDPLNASGHADGDTSTVTLAGTALVVLLLAVNIGAFGLVSAGLIGLVLLLAAIALCETLRVHRIGLLAVPFTLYWVLSGFVADAGPFSGQPLIEWVNADGRYVVAMVPLVVAAVMRPTRADLRLVFTALRVMVWANLLLLGAGLARLPGTQETIRGVNYFGLTSSHHAAGYIFGATLIIVAMRSASTGWREQRLTLAACLVLLLASGSRTTLVGIVFALVWLAFSSGRFTILLRSAVAIVVGGILAVFANERLSNTAAGLASAQFRERAWQVFTTGLSRDEATTYVAALGGALPGYLANIVARFWYWGNAIGMWSQSPFLGIGSWRYNDSALHYEGRPGLAAIATGGVNQPDALEGAHNQYLGTLAENGLVGLVLLMVIWIGLYRASGRNQVAEKWQRQSAQLLIPFALGTALTGYTLTSPAFTFVGLSWAALVAAAGLPTRTRGSRGRDVRPARLASR